MSNWYPRAERKEIRPGSNDPPIKVRGAILHVDAGNTRDLYDYFSERSGGIESHFQIARDGHVFQYRSLGYEADANWKANSFYRNGERWGYVSIETQGLERGKWTQAQMRSIKALLLWLSEQFDFPLDVCKGPESKGVGYHTLFGAPGPWTPVSKSCPGPDRKRQFHGELTDWMREETDRVDERPDPGGEEDVPLAVGPVRLPPSRGPRGDDSPERKVWEPEPLRDGVLPGRRHKQVRALQRALIAAGYGPIRGAVTTFYGPNTQAAVARFHDENNRFRAQPHDVAIGPRGWETLQEQARGAS